MDIFRCPPSWCDLGVTFDLGFCRMFSTATLKHISPIKKIYGLQQLIIIGNFTCGVTIDSYTSVNKEIN